MAETKLGPLQYNVPITYPQDGTPTPYFIQFLQQLRVEKAITDALAAEAVPQARMINTTDGLLGGGDLSADLTLSADVQAILDQLTTTRGSVIYRGSSLWSVLTPGTAGDVLTTNGSGADPSWETPSAGGGGGGYDFSPPPAADFTLFSGDANAVTLTDDSDVGLVMKTTVASSGSITRGGYKSLPAVGTDFSVSMFCKLLAPISTYTAGGLTMYESATGKAYDFHLFANGGDTQIRRTTIAGSYTSDVKFNPRLVPSAPVTVAWLQIKRVGTTLTFSVSLDGKNWLSVLSESQTAYMTTAPNRIGPGFWLLHATDVPLLTVPAWYQTGF